MNGSLQDRAGDNYGFVLLYVLWMSVAISAIIFLISARGRDLIKAESKVETRMSLQKEVYALMELFKKSVGGGRMSAGYKHVVDRCTVEVTNANGLLNINHSTEEEIIRLCEAVEISEMDRTAIAHAILDWIDTDNDTRTCGAEDSYYQGLTPAYHIADKDITSVDELMLIKGMNRDYFDRLKNQISFSATGVNFQETTPEVTYALCGDHFMAEKLIEYRKTDFINSSALEMLLGENLYMSLSNRIVYGDSKSNRITVSGRQGAVEVRLTEWIDTKL